MQELLKDYLQDLISQERHMLGNVFWLFNCSALHRRYSVEIMLQYILPALKLKQYLYYEQFNKPVAFCNWAFVSDEVLQLSMNGNYRLGPNQWSSGDNLFFPEFIAPFGHCRKMVKHLK